MWSALMSCVNVCCIKAAYSNRQTSNLPKQPKDRPHKVFPAMYRNTLAGYQVAKHVFLSIQNEQHHNASTQDGP